MPAYVWKLAAYIAFIPIILQASTDVWRYTLLYLHAIGLVCLVMFGSSKSNDMYSLNHVVFNLVIPPKTLWFNMGLWDNDALEFPEACETLATAVINRLDIKKPVFHALHVLDVGYGCGDSCFLLAETYKCRVTGVTNEPTQWHISKHRLEHEYSALLDMVQLIQGSATEISCLLENRMFDRILCVDSAYHYQTRYDFLKSAYTHLLPGGTLALFDLCLHDSLYPANWITRWIAKSVLQIPTENLCTVDDYREQLATLGYEEVAIETLQQGRVFGGLSRAIQRQIHRAHVWDATPSVGNKAFMVITAWMFGLLAKNTWITPIIVSAKKKS